MAEVARNAILAEKFDANQQQLTEALVQVIVLAQRAGEIAAALNPHELAQLILDVIESQALRQAIFPRKAPTVANHLLEQLIFTQA